MADEIRLTVGDALAIRRLLWDIGSTESTQHDQKVECFHWGAKLDYLAGMPGWQVGDVQDDLIAFYEGVRRHIDGLIESLRSTP